MASGQTVLSVFLFVLAAAGELATMSLSSFPATDLQGRAKLAYPVYRKATLVVMPGISAEAATVEARSRHRVYSFGTSLLLSHPLDSAEAATLVATLCAGAEKERFAAQALQASLYLGWRRSIGPNASWGVGVSASNSATGTSVTPILTWDRKFSPRLRFVAVLPAIWDLGWEASPAWRLGLRQTALGGSWLLDSSRSLSSSQVSLDLFARRRFGPIALDLSGGWMFLNQRRLVENDRSALTVYGYDVFSSQHAHSVPNRMGPAFRVALLFLGRN